MINIKRLTVGVLQSNCYLIWDSSKDALIVDPGDDAEFIISTINQLELTPKAIIATHGHFDHIMAALEIKLTFKLPFYMHKDDEFLLDRMEETALHFINFDPGPAPEVDVYLKDAAELKICSEAGPNHYQLKVIHTPGHTPGSVCLYFEREKAVFVGDLLFADGSVGRTDFSYSDKKELEKSLEKIKSLPADTVVYPGHGGSLLLRDMFIERRKMTPLEKPRKG